MPEAVCLIIPCYNEEKRIPIDKIAKYVSTDLNLLFVDDGSTDGTRDKLERFFANDKKNVQIIALTKNSGKAEAVRQGVLHLHKLGQIAHYHWIGYWDADTSTSLDEINNMISYHHHFYPEAISIWGSRVVKLGSLIQRIPTRYILGKFFVTIVTHFFKIKCHDSQCGAKIFRSNVVSEIFSESFIHPLLFDIELFFRLKGQNIIEYPLKKWTEKPSSKVNITAQLFPIFWGLIQIKRKYQLKTNE